LKIKVNSIAIKYILLGLFILLASLTSSSYLIYINASADLEKAIGNELKGIARSASLQINYRNHENIFLDESGAISGLKYFKQIKKVLSKIRKINNLKKPIYTMRKVFDFDSTGEIEFVVMTNLSKNGKAYTGNRIKISSYAQKVFNDGNAIATKLYSDTEGMWISGIAPIKDSQGTVLGLLYIDRDANFFLAANSALQKKIFIISLITLFIGSIAFFLFVQPILKKLRTLREGTQKLALGSLDHRIKIKGHDEFKELADSFNEMTTKLEENRKNLELLANDLKSTNTAYARFVPKELLSFLKKSSIVDITLGDQVETNMAILFSDIRSFTTMSEKMSPQETFNFLNSYLKRMEPIISKRNGFIDKYIGDAIMALFPKSIDDALLSAIDMCKELRNYNELRINEQGYEPISIGIGLHTGSMILGTIGGEARMEGTVISDAVNLSARLEELTKKYNTKIIISEKSLFELKNKNLYNYRYLGKNKIKGKNNLIAIYEVFDGDNDQQIELKRQTREVFDAAIKSFFQKEYSEAQELFKKVLQLNPRDSVTKIFLEKLSK